jgi:uncharacterized protein (TIGR00369 family)
MFAAVRKHCVMTDRTRTVTWADPQVLLAAFAGKPGLELLQGIVAGTLPQAPISQTMSFALVAASNGETRFRCVPGEFLYNPQGSVHGGVAATLLDSCTGAAVMSTLDAATAYTTTQLSVSMVRAILADTGELFADGKVIHRGGRLVTAEGRLTDAKGKLYAHGTASCMLFPRAQ